MSDERSKWKLAAAFVLVFVMGVLVGLLLCGNIHILEGTGDLTVFVEDESGNSINGAFVSLNGGSSEPVTGQDASKTFQDVPFGPHDVAASAAGYATNMTDVVVNEQNKEVTIVLSDSQNPPKSGM